MVMTVTGEGQMTVEDSVDAGFLVPEGETRQYFYKRFNDFVNDFKEGMDLDFNFLSCCPPHAEVVRHPFFADYLREQKELLPTLGSRGIIARDKYGQPAAVKVGYCQATRGPHPKPVRHMSEPARILASQFSQEVPRYVLPPTGKKEALNSLISRSPSFRLQRIGRIW